MVMMMIRMRRMFEHIQAISSDIQENYDDDDDDEDV